MNGFANAGLAATKRGAMADSEARSKSDISAQMWKVYVSILEKLNN